MPAWSEVRDLRTWMLRGFSLRGAVLCLAVLAVLISEVRFNWVEILMGRYLAATNSYRPESGNVWEQGRLRQVATQTLEQMVTDQLTAQREAREASSLAELVDGLSDSRGTMISAERFKALYSQVPEAVARTLFSPILMLRISAEKSWERVYLERENGQVGIYLLDRANNVLSYTTISGRRLESTGVGGPLVSGTLEEHPEFSGRIYPADRFFMALDALSPEVQRGVLPRPATVLAVEGNPVRVGISDEVNADAIRIAIEMETPRGRQLLITVGQEWAVWQLRLRLEPRLARPATQRSGWLLRGGDR
ncbi:hypothetical protein [Desulfosarcina ovata]|uniref:Uncharacterized protein n=1 Tax=Desulfosarcina ovata subsp. ovata TaxID=2752305 RepID=A0A5K8AJL6_9BACT|nr:hypothetical protein [Desulfosarcina ovata]BBO92903.1 hypothetical protein DSCOOX_60830 [Desulfosarcina ovata subsp. ovata]